MKLEWYILNIVQQKSEDENRLFISFPADTYLKLKHVLNLEWHIFKDEDNNLS